LEELNESLRQRDKMKDDAIAQLSDQLMALTTRMQEIERKQQLICQKAPIDSAITVNFTSLLTTV